MADQSNRRLRPQTLTAHAGGFTDAVTGGVIPPIQPSTTFHRRPDYQLVDDAFIYGRDDNSVYRQAEDILCQLEGGKQARLFPSGMAAIAAVARTVPSGGAIALQRGIYYGTSVWMRKFCDRRQITLAEFDATDAGDLDRAIADHGANLVFIETPSNPMLDIVDIAGTAQRAHAAGAILAVDSTAATPIFSQPLSHGADIVVHSATKALNGHSDVLAGALVCREPELGPWKLICEDRHDAGAILGAFEAWLLIRGMRTLAIRVERAADNALQIAQFLNDHPAVHKVHYPGLTDHPSHDLAARQMTGGFGYLLSFQVNGGGKEALAVAGRLSLILRATSLGGVESLVEHRHTIEGDVSDVPEDLLRLSVGIEHIDDLIGDLDQALKG